MITLSPSDYLDLLWYKTEWERMNAALVNWEADYALYMHQLGHLNSKPTDERTWAELIEQKDPRCFTESGRIKV